MSVREVTLLVTIRLETAEPSMSVDVALPPATVESPYVGEDQRSSMLWDGSSKRTRPFLEAFQRRAAELGMSVARPTGERQNYRNVLPPPGHGASRVAYVNIKTGRLGIQQPALARSEPLSDVFNNKGQPAGTRIYLQSEAHIEAAVRLCTQAIEHR